jgi:hypothetical protein
MYVRCRASFVESWYLPGQSALFEFWREAPVPPEEIPAALLKKVLGGEDITEDLLVVDYVSSYVTREGDRGILQGDSARYRACVIRNRVLAGLWNLCDEIDGLYRSKFRDEYFKNTPLRRIHRLMRKKTQAAIFEVIKTQHEEILSA